MISDKLKKILSWAGLFLVGYLAALVIANAPRTYPTFSGYSSVVDFGGVSLDGLSLLIVFFLLINYFLMAIMGYALARPFFEGGPVKSVELRVIGSFFIGYICLAGVVRVISFICPYRLIYWPVLGTELLILLISSWGKKGLLSTQVGQGPFLIFFLKRLGWGLLLAFFFMAVLLLQIRQAEFSWVGHGLNQYAHFLNDWYLANLQRFPLLSRHYDELIVHYFLGMPIQGTLCPLVIWWITLGLIKTSVLVFLWIAFRRIGLSSIFAGLGALFLFFGTSALNPARYYLLFDSSNFLFFTVHSGRVAGIAMVIFWIVNFLREDILSNPLSLLMIILTGIGFTSLPETNALWIFILLPWLFLLRKEVDFPGARCIYFALAVVILLYGVPFGSNIFIGLRVIAVGAVGMICRRIFAARLEGCWKFPQNTGHQAKTVRRGLIALALSILVGMVFMGNLFRDNAISRWTFQIVEPMIGHVERKELSGDLLSKAPFQIRDFREVGAYNQFCWGALEFVACYGWVLIMIALIPYLYYRLSKKRSSIDQRIYGMFAFLVTIMPLLFFIMDFTDLGPQRAWLKSRFLEVPVYFIFFFFFYFLNRAASKLERLVVGLLLVVYMVTPFLANHRPIQIWDNGKNLISHGFLKQNS